MSETADTPGTTPGQAKKGAGGCLLLVAITGAIAIAWMVFGSSSSSSSPDGDEVAAYVVCQQWVEEQLKAPSTADFPPTQDISVTHTGPQWTVIGYVDAQNGFGAMIRTNFTCDAKHIEGDRYRGSATLIE